MMKSQTGTPLSVLGSINTVTLNDGVNNFQGSTDGSPNSIQGSCGPTITSPQNFYRFYATFTHIIISTCNQADFDTKLSLFQIDTSSTEAIGTCIGGNDDGCSLTSRYESDIESSKDYLIIVHGFQNQSGTYTLSVTPSNFFITYTITKTVNINNYSSA